jgi:serine/threonine protein kinase
MAPKKKSNLPLERDGIKAENPEKYYTFGEEIGRGKFSVVKHATCKKTGKQFAAKIIKFDDLSLKFAIREYDLMVSDKLKYKNLAEMHEAYLVRKYLIIVMTLCDGKTLLEYFASKHSITEEDIAIIIRELCTILKELHSRNIVHLDIRPTNIRLHAMNDIKLLDYNSARHLANKKAGEVVDVIGDTEFCAPEMLSFDRVQPGSDMWSIAVIMYILLSGISPYYYEDEAKVSLMVEKVNYKFDEDAFENVTPEAKDFIKKCFKRGPEMRLTAAAALDHKWLSEDYSNPRKRSTITKQDQISSTDVRLLSEEEEEYVEASLVFKTYDEEEHVSTEEDDDDEDED